MQILMNILIGYAIASTIFTTIFLIGLIRNIRREVKIIEGVKEAAQTIKIVYVEYDIVDSMYRMYDKLNNTFICQAKDELELWKIAKAKFPDRNVITLGEDREAKHI